MQLLRTMAELATLNRPVNIALGVFDGVHLGHQRVIAAARSSEAAAVVLTFDPHPMRVLHPEKAPLLLTSTRHKLALLERGGADAVLLLPFTLELARMSPEKFLEQLAAPAHRVRQICIGARFHFGHQRAGNVGLMQRLAERLGFTVVEIPPVHTADGEMISSSAIRSHILHGRLDRAAAMLGRPFSLLGTVVVGDRRGRTLGFPTANLHVHNEVLPPDGVYTARVEHRPAVVNIGRRQTFPQATPGRHVEVHLLDFDGDLYGQDIEVSLLQKLRGERRFPSVEAFQQQVRADIALARQLLG